MRDTLAVVLLLAFIAAACFWFGNVGIDELRAVLWAVAQSFPLEVK